MRYAAGHKEQTRAKILRAAGKVFRRAGYHAAGVDQVMEEAGLTAGGFYAHFRSKEALLAEVLTPAVAISDPIALPAKPFEGKAGHAAAEAFIDRYLDPRHMRNTEGGCPLPALAADVARAGAPVKASFEAIVRNLAARLVGDSGGALSEERALALLALCVGGLGVARSVQDEALGEKILASCRDLAKASLCADPGPPATAPTRERKPD